MKVTSLMNVNQSIKNTRNCPQVGEGCQHGLERSKKIIVPIRLLYLYRKMELHTSPSGVIPSYHQNESSQKDVTPPDHHIHGKKVRK